MTFLKTSRLSNVWFQIEKKVVFSHLIENFNINNTAGKMLILFNHIEGCENCVSP